MNSRNATCPAGQVQRQVGPDHHHTGERRRLIKAARGLSREILRQVASIFSPATLLKWLNRDNKPKSNKPSTRKPGRPRTPDEIRELIVRIATETGWRYPDASFKELTTRNRGLPSCGSPTRLLAIQR